MVVFDGVFRQIVNHLVQVILAGEDGSLPFNLTGELHAPFLRHKAQHPRRAPDNRRNIDASRLLHRAAVQSGQAQQVFRDAGQALRLLPDVPHKLADGLSIHVPGLQDGVGEQANACQRRFQLVGGVGHKAAAHLLRGLQTVGKAVELPGNLRDFIVSAHLGPLSVVALPHLPDGSGEQAEAACQDFGEYQAEQRDKQQHGGGDAQQRALQILQQRRLLRVIFIGINRADGLAAVDHGGGAAAAEGRAVKHGVKHVVALKRLHDFRVEHIAAQRAVRLAGIVENAPGAVGHEDAGNSSFLRHRQRRCNAFLAQRLQPRQRGGHNGNAGLEGRLLGTEDQILRHGQRVGVHQHQHRNDDRNVTQAEFDLQTHMADGASLPSVCPAKSVPAIIP